MATVDTINAAITSLQAAGATIATTIGALNAAGSALNNNAALVTSIQGQITALGNAGFAPTSPVITALNNAVTAIQGV